MEQPLLTRIALNVSALAAASVLFIVGIAVWAAYASWVRALEGAEITSNNLVNLIERQLSETFTKVEASTLTVVTATQHRLRVHGKFDAPELHELLAPQKKLVPEIGYFGVTDAQGVVQIGDGALTREVTSVADRDYFQQLRDHPEIQSVMYGPLAEKVSKRWVVGFAARIKDARGNFGGVVFSAIPVAVIQRDLEALNLGQSGAVTVRSETMVLVARAMAQRTDAVTDTGSQNVSTQLQAAIASNPQKGRFIAMTAPDKIERINSYSRIGSYPMYVVLGLSKDDLIAGVWSQILVIFAFAGLASAIAISAALLLNKSIRKQQSYAEVLQESEARYARVVDGAQEGMWEWNLKTQGMVVSPRFSTMLGYAPGEWIPTLETWKLQLHPDDVDATMTRLSRHIAGETPAYGAEFRMRKKSGDWIWIQSRGRVVTRDASGQPELVSGTQSDVTARKDLEEKLTALNRDFVSFLEHTGDFVFFKDRESRFRFCSQTLATITGHASWREMTGKHDMEVFPPELARIYYEEELPVFRDGVPLVNKVDPFIDVNAKPGWVSTNKWPLRDASGNVCGIFGVSRIVTDQIRLQREHEMLLAEQKAILDNGLVPIMAAQDWIIRWVNPAFEKLFGFKQGEFIGQSIRFGFPSDASYEAFGASAYLALNNGEPYRTECEFQRKDGSRFFAEVSGTGIAAEPGKSLWCFMDITERKLHEERIRQLAFYDPLTQLPNRRLFGDRFSQAMAQSERNQSYGAILVLDLDNFKPLNDTHGHAAGDLLLKQAAQRISNCIRETDTVGRFGGDEFVVVLGPLGSQREEAKVLAQAVAEKIRVAIGEPYEISLLGDLDSTKVSHRCTASVGAVLFLGNQRSADELFQQADMAMYEAKESGRNQVKLK